MADKVELDFVAKGTIFDDLDRMAKGVDALGDTHRKVQDGIQSDLQATAADARQMAKTFDQAGQLVTALAKSAGAGFPALIGSLKNVEDVTKRVTSALSAKDISNFTAANAGLREIALRQGVILKGVSDETKARIEALVVAGKLPQEQAQLLLQTQEVVEALRESAHASEEVHLPLEKSVETVRELKFETIETVAETKTLALQYRAAAENARRIGQQFGLTSPQFKEATTEAARLKKVIDDTGASIKALNPGDKIAPFTALGNAISGGAQAVGGFFVAFTDGNQELQQAIFKFQSLLFAVQGAQSFLKDFKDAVNNVKLALGLTTAAQEVANAVTTEGSIASEAAAEASLTDAAAKRSATIATAQEVAGIDADIAAKEAQAVATGESVAASEADVLAKSEQSAANLAGVAASEAGAIAQEEQVAATVEGIAASEADAAAKVGQAVASGAATGATELLTIAMGALNAVLAINPFVLAAAAIAAIVLVVLSLGEATEDATHKFDRLNEAIDRAIEKRKLLRDAAQKLSDLDADKKAIEGLGTAEEKRAAIQLRSTQEEGRLRQVVEEQTVKADLARVELLRLVLELKKEINKDDASGAVKTLDKIKELNAELSQEKDAIFEANTDIRANEKRTANELLQLQKDTNKERIEIANELSNQLLSVQDALQKRLSELEAQASQNPREKLLAERKLIEDRISQEELDLQREIAINKLRVTTAKETFDQLSEVRKRELADRIIKSGGAEIPEQIQKAFNAIRLANEVEFQNKLSDILQEEAKARLDLLVEGTGKENAAFEFALQDRIDAHRKALGAEFDAVKFADRERAAFRLKQKVDDVQLDEQIQEAIINGRVRGSEREKDFERQKQLDILAVKIEGAKAELALIPDTDDKATELRRRALDATIADLKNAQKKLKEDIPTFDILDLFGVKEKDKARVSGALNDIFSSTLSIIASGIQAQQAQVDAQISATDQIIADEQRRQDELKGLLDTALEDQRLGRANNADAIRKQIEESKRVEKEELENKKRLREEKKKLAKQQIRLDAVSQGSSIATSIANLISTWSSLPFGVGLIAAFAQAALLISFMASTRAKLKAVDDTPSLRKGGKLKGARHDVDGLGGIAMFDRRNGEQIAWAEDGEHVTNRDASKRHDPLLTAINSNDIGRVHQAAEEELRKAGKIVLNAKAIQKATIILRQHGPTNDRQFLDLIAEVRGQREELRGLREEVAVFKKQERDRPRTEGKALVTGNRKVTAK